MAIKFNNQQEKVFKQLQSFVAEDRYDTFILNGYAGTGKTFLIQEFAAYLKKQNFKFALLASTGRAAAVLRGKTEFNTKTVHGALYSFSKVDGDEEHLTADSPADDFGQMKLIFEPNEKLDDPCIYLVDEASMIASENPDNDTSFAVFGNGSLLPDLLNALGDNKIVFIGDHCQLPPIYQNISPALSKKWLTDFGRNVQCATLSQIMRTKEDNDILAMAADVRQTIGTYHPSKWIKLPAKNRKNCKVLSTPNLVFLEYYTQFLQNGPVRAIGIAHSNKACNKLNDLFRKHLYPGERKVLEKGEILMVSQNNYLVPLSNGDFVKVLKLGEITTRSNLKFRNIRIQHLTTEKEFEIKIALDPLGSSLANLNPDQQRNLMIDFSRRMRRKGIKPKSEAYNEAMQKDIYLNSLRAKYGYVVTCHKSQGGEWDDVFLFLDKAMYGYMNHDQMRKWWYTAITRTKHQLYLHEGWWLK